MVNEKVILDNFLDESFPVFRAGYYRQIWFASVDRTSILKEYEHFKHHTEYGIYKTISFHIYELFMCKDKT